MNNVNIKTKSDAVLNIAPFKGLLISTIYPQKLINCGARAADSGVLSCEKEDAQS